LFNQVSATENLKKILKFYNAILVIYIIFI
jgi:hypothetical protein